MSTDTDKILPPNPADQSNQVDQANQADAAARKAGFFSRIINWCTRTYEYVSDGVWSDPRNTLGVRMIKTVNLTLSAFFDSSLQIRSMALTYSTVLSIVPAIALLVAIGRGFGLQEVLQRELFHLFPSQAQGLSTAFTFVDSYLKSTTQGLFVGVGIVVLLYTVISLLSYIEDTFNSIWGIRVQRTLYHKITDYIAICLMIPVLMICSSGVSIFISTVIKTNLNLPFLTPLINWSLELIPFFLAWLAFTLSYYLIPNTRVMFKYAAISGLMAAVCYEVLQWLFLSGQIYVSKYNAIYGSFAFVPLMLVWLQFTWLVVLTGCMIAFSMQNVFTFNLMGNESAISNRGWHNVGLIVMAITARRFADKQPPLTEQQIAVDYYLPIKIVGRVVEKLRKARLVYDVRVGSDSTAISPAVEPSELTVEKFLREFDHVGITAFLSEFDDIYKGYIEQMDPRWDKAYECFGDLLVKDIPIPSPEDIKKIMIQEMKKCVEEHLAR